MIIRENIFHVDIPGYGILLPFCIGIALLIIYTHRKNLDRIFKGNENRVSLFKKKAKATT
jgi:glycerol-3-phosphate acyltransferase PlsY